MHLYKNEAAQKWCEWKDVFLISMLFNMLAYLGCIVNVTYAIDDYGHIFTEVDHLAQGRWIAGFIYNILLQKSFLPSLSPIIGITCSILTGIGLCEFWKIRRRPGLLIILLWSLHPYMLDTYNFRIATINCSVAYLVAMVAVFLASKGKRAFIFAVILFYCSLSIYQVTLGFAVAVVMVQLLLMVFRANFASESVSKAGRLLFRYVLLLVCSVVVYFIVTKLIFMVFDVTVNSRIQAGFISDFEQLKAKLCVVAMVLFVRLGPVREFILPFLGKLGIFLVYVAAIAAVMKKAAKPGLKLLSFLWLLIIPLGAVSFLLPLETLDIPWRVCMGLVVFFAGMFALAQESSSLLIRRTGMVLGCFLVGYFILNNNTIQYKQHLVNQNDLIMGQRIISKIQSLEGYQPGMKLAVVGRVQKEHFTKEGKGNWEIVKEFTQYSMIRRYSLTKSAFETDWSKYSFLLKYMDLELKNCNPQEIEKARFLSHDKKPWPDPSSVFIADGVVVVVLSPPQR